jgi:VanZ family protein
MIALTIAAGTGAMDASAGGWIVLILCGMGLWVCWLYWRGAEGQTGIPGHVLQPFLAVPVIILLMHILAAGGVDPESGRINILAENDNGLMIRMMTLGLLVLLAQDVLSRVRRMRWLLTSVGLIVAVGAILKVSSQSPGPAVEAVSLAGLAGVGILLTPCCLPGKENKVELVARVTSAALLVTLLIVSHRQAAVAAIFATCAVGGTLLLAGVFLRNHRLKLLLIGTVLGISGIVAISRLDLTAGKWISEATLLGTGGLGEVLPSASMSGMGLLVVSAGWVGFSAVVCGMLSALLWSLYVSRGASAGDQARAAIWSVVVVLSGCGLLVRGGLAAPVVIVVAAVTWGLMPHIFAHPVRRYKGWSVMVAFLAVMVVLGLESRVGRSAWVRPLLKECSDGVMHLLGVFGLTAVLLWQSRCRSWRRAIFCTAVGATVAAMGELAQKFLAARSPQLSDVAWDIAGAAAALGVFALIFAVRQLEQFISARPKVSYEGYF